MARGPFIYYVSTFPGFLTLSFYLIKNKVLKIVIFWPPPLCKRKCSKIKQNIVFLAPPVPKSAYVIYEWYLEEELAVIGVAFTM